MSVFSAPQTSLEAALWHREPEALCLRLYSALLNLEDLNKC